MTTDAIVDCPHSDFDEELGASRSAFAFHCASSIKARVTTRDLPGCDFGGPTFGY